MKINEIYSHLNGLEYLMVHKHDLWQEIQDVIGAIDAKACKTKKSEEKRMVGKLLYSPIDMNAAFKKLLINAGWQESRVSYWVTKDEKLIRKTLSMDVDKQKKEIEAAGQSPIYSYTNRLIHRNRLNFFYIKYAENVSAKRNGDIH